MSLVSKILMYIFSFLGFLCALALLILYFVINKKIVDEKKLLEMANKYLKLNVTDLCSHAQPVAPTKKESITQPYHLWVIENLDSEKSATSLLSLSTDEIVKYLTVIEREKSLKILDEIYTVLEEQGELGKKRKIELDKKLLGNIK